jgi:hypothetical protein
MTSRVIRTASALLAAPTLVGGLLASGTLAPVHSPAKAAEAPAPPPVIAPDDFGTIKGQLIWGGADVPERKVLVKKGDTSVKDAEVCAATDLISNELVVDPKTKGIRYGLAFLKGTLSGGKSSLAGKNSEAEKALVSKEPDAIVDQKNCEFLPYMKPIFTGQRAVFKSSDPVGHNVRFSGFANLAKNVVLAPNGELVETLKAERLPMELRCDIHPWMKGWVMPLDHPFFAVTKEDGTFEITGVPAGKQTLIVWQEKVGYANEEGSKGKEVTVEAGKVTDVGVVKLDPGKVKK